MNIKYKQKLILKEFVRFLKKENAYEEFIINLNSPKANTFRGDDMDAVSFIANAIKTNPSHIFNDAFDWYETSKDSSYWYALHYIWCDKIDEMRDMFNKF